MRKNKILLIAKIAIFTALSAVLYFIRFPLPPFPSFLEVQFSNLPVIIGGFIMGPIEGVAIVLLRTIIVLPFSTTQYVGELADLLIGVFVVLTVSFIYKKVNTKKGGVLSLGIGIIVWTLSAIFSNKVILLPYYMKVYGLSADNFIDILKVIPWVKIFKTIDSSNYMRVYIFACVIPFNIVVSTLVSIITFIVYKKVSNVFHKFEEKSEEKEGL